MTVASSPGSPRSEDVTLESITRGVRQLHDVQNWPRRPPEQRLQFLISEVFELWDALVAYRNAEDTKRAVDAERIKAEVGKEIFDILWNLADLADTLGIDLASSAKEKQEELLKRDWREHGDQTHVW